MLFFEENSIDKTYSFNSNSVLNFPTIFMKDSLENILEMKTLKKIASYQIQFCEKLQTNLLTLFRKMWKRNCSKKQKIITNRVIVEYYAILNMLKSVKIINITFLFVELFLFLFSSLIELRSFIEWN